jgi:hypothetical protein
LHRAPAAPFRHGSSYSLSVAPNPGNTHPSFAEQ